LRKRQFKEAQNLAQEALSAIPNDALVMSAAGKAQLQVGDYEQAIGTFRKLAGALPKEAGPFLLLAQVYRAQNKPEAAENAITKALELEPDNADVQMALVEVLSGSNRSKTALQFVRRLQQSKPRSAVGYSLEAAIHARQKDIDAAAIALRTGLSKTDSSDLAGRLYSLYVSQNRSQEADKLAQQWLKQKPDDAAFEYLVSVKEIAAGDLRSAEARLKRVVVVYPRNALALNNLAWILVQHKDKAALEFAQRANNILPDRPPFMDTLALALAAENLLTPAIQLQRAAVELDPKDPSLRLTLARLALQAGDKALAREELRVLEPLGTKFEDHAEVAKLLKKL
jgi:cellulose synthase operon protein C